MVDLPPATSYIARHARILGIFDMPRAVALPLFDPLPPGASRWGGSWAVLRQRCERLCARINPSSMVCLWLWEITKGLVSPQRSVARVMVVACGLYILLTVRPVVIGCSCVPFGNRTFE